MSEIVTLAAETAASAGVNSSIDRSVSMADRMLLGLKTTILGLGTVFAVLVILMGVLMLFKLFFYVIPEKRRKAAEAPAVSESIESTDKDADDGAIVAAITAAISLCLSNEAKNTGEAEPAFRVVNFRRIGKSK